MGRVVAPYGVHGWMRVAHFTGQSGALLDYPVWWLRLQDDEPWKPLDLDQGAVRGRGVVAKLQGVDTPEAVVALHGALIAVPREQLPDSEPGQFYFSDLVGLPVFNVEGESFGTVSGIIETGANEVLVVSADRERLIPFIESVIKSVEPTRGDPSGRIQPGKIVVDWGSDY